MQLKIVLFSLMMVIFVNGGKKPKATGAPASAAPGTKGGAGAPATGKGPQGTGAPGPAPAPAPPGKAPNRNMVEEKRKEVPIADASLSADVAPVNVQSLKVPQFHDNDLSFSTIYPMKCGARVRALALHEGVARKSTSHSTAEDGQGNRLVAALVGVAMTSHTEFTNTISHLSIWS
ncbi:hypothetical protein GCK32_018014 [Trichostrongylus colubriformis]|uniref:Uncharacterized protein n=1 Tax=Trichostrongylus colubriformis TaxID=6319 RepID=A0AAN8F7J9_TRICO